MALNVEQLIAGLDDYKRSLEGHNQSLTEDFNSLQELFYRLAAEYDGQAANAFKASWGRTAEWFEEYMQNTKELSKFLEERVDRLKRQGE